MTTIRVYFELETMDQVAAVLAFAETIGMPARMAPLAHGKRRGLSANAATAAEHPIDKRSLLKLGDPDKLPKDSEARERWPRIAQIFKGDKGASIQYRHIIAQ